MREAHFCFDLSVVNDIFTSSLFALQLMRLDHGREGRRQVDNRFRNEDWSWANREEDPYVA